LSEITWYFQRLDWWSVLDILLVASTFYFLLRLIRGTQAVQLLRGAVLLVLVMVLVTSLLPLRAFGWLVSKGLPALLVSIPVIFQPELRRALEIDPNDSIVLYNVACNYATLGRVEESLDYLERAIEHGTASPGWMSAVRSWRIRMWT